jgi:hypothetical protein
VIVCHPANADLWSGHTGALFHSAVPMSICWLTERSITAAVLSDDRRVHAVAHPQQI